MQTRATYVAERGGQIVGFAQLDLERGEVEAVCVSPDAVRTKVGTALLHQLEEVAECGGLREITLKSTLNAEPFYAQQGYERLGPAQHADLDCVQMRKTLPHPLG